MNAVTHFSVAIALTEDQKPFWRQLLALKEDASVVFAEGDSPGINALRRYVADDEETDFKDLFGGLTLILTEDEVSIESAEDGNVDHVVTIIDCFLAYAPEHAPVSFEVAYFGLFPTEDSSHGEGHYVTGKGSRWIGSSQIRTAAAVDLTDLHALREAFDGAPTPLPEDLAAAIRAVLGATTLTPSH